MAEFESSLRSASLAILKRDLAEGERVEFLELASAIGMKNVEDFLYMLMVFKRNEDKVTDVLNSFRDEMREKFDEMGALEKKIDEGLESSIAKVLGDGAREIGRDMGNRIAESARRVLGASEEFHFMRGQLFVAGLVITLSTVAYMLGAVYGFGASENGDFLDILLHFPAGSVVFVCGFAHVGMWCCDHWELVKENTVHKVRLGLEILVLLALLVYLI
jgi:hypothetical protein